MEALKKLSNQQKGKLLADLFPAYKETICDTVERSCAYMFEHEKEIRLHWKTCLITYDAWLTYAQQLGDAIRKHRYTIYKSNTVFADQLFSDQKAALTIQCIKEFAKAIQKETHLKIALVLLFCEEREFPDYFTTPQ